MLKEKYEKTKNYISQPIPYMVLLHIITVLCLWLFTIATDFAFSLALTGGLSLVEKAVCIFLSNSMPFFGTALVTLKIIDILCEFIPEDEDNSEFTLTIPLKQLLIIIAITAATAVAVAITFHNHIGFSSRIYGADPSNLFDMSTISL